MQVAEPPGQIGGPAELAPDARYTPLAGAAYKWHGVVWTCLLPQLILGLLNWRMLSLVWGDMEKAQRTNALCIGGMQALLFACCAGVAWFARTRKNERRELAWPLQLAVMLLPIGYLCAVVFGCNNLIPQSAALWILPPEAFFYHQFAFMMPGIFYGATLLACFPSKWRRGADIGISICAAIGMPLAWLAIIQLFQFFPRGLEAVFPFIMAVFICTTVLMGIALIRALAGIYCVLRERGRTAVAILAFLIGIAAPLGGLLLNRSIPFPADFQTPGVYVLAVINGLALLLPPGRAGWLVRCALFPFVLYFLAVFLPFLPLSIIAILAAGAGFLILAPVLLFLMQGQRLLHDFQIERARLGTRRAALLGLAAFLLMPAYFVTEAFRDRVSIRHALDYVYTPDYRARGRFDGSPSVLRRSLLHLRDFKAGNQFPFLSGFYNWLVFDNLVLPDEKIQRLHRVFFGGEMPAAKANMGGFFSTGGRRGAMSMSETASAPPPPSGDCILGALDVRAETGSGETRTLATLHLQNNGAAVGEFVTRVSLPDGMLVSGFWLHIGTERVPGRLFEKKTALWVYQKIRDMTRRDPGILIFQNPHTVELRVFPLAAGEKRTVEIEFLAPSGSRAEVRIGGRTVPAGDGAGGAWLASVDASTDAVAFSAEASARLPVAHRVPYLHFIVSRAANGAPDAAVLPDVIRRAAEKFPAASEGRVTFANYECLDTAAGPQPLAQLPVNAGALPARGGFLAGAAVKRALLQHHDAFAHAPAGSPWLTRYPVIVIVGDCGGEEKSWKLEEFARLAPDAPELWISDGRNEPRRVAFDTSDKSGATQRKVAVLRRGDANAALPLDTSGVVDFPAVSAPAGIQCLNADGRFDPLAENVTRMPSESRFGKGIGAWLDNFALCWNPSLERDTLPRLVQRSRDTGVMVGATSYIVVENSAQWEILLRKEKTKLRNNSALEIESLPEPSAVLFVGLGAAAMAMRRPRRTKRE